MERSRSELPWCATAVALVLLGALPEAAPAAEGDEAVGRCWEGGWKAPCAIALPCASGAPFGDAVCDYTLPRDCSSLESLECGEMPDRVRFEECLAGQAICSRITQIGAGDPIAVYEYVNDFDFVNGLLSALPGDLVCQGLLSPDTDRWCSYLETVYPEASFLEASVWQARELLPDAAKRERFARIAAEPHPECRMREGQLLARVDVDETGFRCPPGAPLPEPDAASLRLSDVAFSDVNHDGYLDAVMTVAWSGGGSGGTTATLGLTRLAPNGPLVPLRELAPGFDCAKAATPTEKRICADPRLGLLDGRLAKLYGHLRQKTKSEGDAARRAALGDEQRRFLRQRDAVCSEGNAVPCLALHGERIAALQQLATRDRCQLSAVCD